MWGPDRAAVAWGASPPLRWAGAAGCVGRGGQDSVRLPVSPRPRAPIVVGARPPPRCPCRRPTALAADTAGAAPNLGVFQNAVACRCAPRSITPASGAAEASCWAASSKAATSAYPAGQPGSRTIGHIPGSRAAGQSGMALKKRATCRIRRRRARPRSAPSRAV